MRKYIMCAGNGFSNYESWTMDFSKKNVPFWELHFTLLKKTLIYEKTETSLIWLILYSPGFIHATVLDRYMSSIAPVIIIRRIHESEYLRFNIVCKISNPRNYYFDFVMTVRSISREKQPPSPRPWLHSSPILFDMFYFIVPISSYVTNRFLGLFVVNFLELRFICIPLQTVSCHDN